MTSKEKARKRVRDNWWRRVLRSTCSTSIIAKIKLNEGRPVRINRQDLAGRTTYYVITETHVIMDGFASLNKAIQFVEDVGWELKESIR